MALPINEDQQALANSVAAFARRTAPIAETRTHVDALSAGSGPGMVWDAVVRQGWHNMHLPESVDGSECGLDVLAVVVEQFGKSMFPGHYVPTVIASAVAATASSGAGDLLLAFSEGSTGAIVAGNRLTARQTATGWVVDGLSDPTLGLPGAAKFLVRAADVDAPDVNLWFWLDGAGASATATVTPCDALDLTRSVGRLELAGHSIAQNQVLAGIDQVRVDLIVTALLGAEASGIAAWCLETAVDYVRTRHQFGRPVGSFQAVQHKAALMLVRSQIACAAAWDAARAAEGTSDQQQLVAAQAALNAAPSGIDQALDCISLLGGIGFTWEHDVHLYWRRAVSIASVVGTEDEWSKRLGEVAQHATRDFSFVDQDTLPDLRVRVGEVLDDILALPEDEVATEGWAPSRGGARRARLAAEGLTAPHYPQPFGLDAGPLEQAVIGDEFAQRGLVQPDTGIAEWVLPTLIAQGTEEQQKRFVPTTLRGELVWCQLFSEPGAGSDLAGLSTKARKVDGGWVLSGQKVWNSQAREADWGVCLARTDADVKKHAGLTYCLIDMNSTGVDVRPLQQATGVWEFNEVFFDDVFVPDDCVVAGPGDGWRLAVTTLSNERLKMGTAKFGHGSADTVRQLLDGGEYGSTRDEVVRVLGRNTGRELSVGAMNLMSVLQRLHGTEDTTGSATSVQKVFHAIAQRDGSRALVGLLGPLGAVGSPEEPYVQDYLGVPAVLIGGGTIEIQLNVIAQRVLGLPR
ncbi:acyl-CoA dehydrogenase [Rhodococcus sp. ARC_M6]|uniref:acyl-CoA dehydrogenase n=1 Tax=Rhodococcus sp. ARC_M6 TaxID=2928852 RepID=UPI001FB271CB|nr:acyl-CoA dehydrogenase [Rhodococcus sp. ARC_M6]MCJ0904779.1 acyl-CoA dehydrogenase [Rhodococcus sp. ARC_M6]